MTEFDPIKVLSELAAEQRETARTPDELIHQILKDVPMGAARRHTIQRITGRAGTGMCDHECSGLSVPSASLGSPPLSERPPPLVGGQPSDPRPAGACRTSTHVDANAWIIEPSGDPMAGCAEAWGSAARSGVDATAAPAGP